MNYSRGRCELRGSWLPPERDIRDIGPLIPQVCIGCGVRNDDGGDWQGSDFQICAGCEQRLCPICEERRGSHRCRDGANQKAHFSSRP